MKNPLSIKGRIGRIEFLIISIIYLSYSVFFFVIFLDDLFSIGTKDQPNGIVTIVLSILLFIIFWILIAGTAKRLHDLNHSGWWQLLGYILPFAQLFFWLWLIIWKGNEGPNKYGKNSGKSQSNLIHDMKTLFTPFQEYKYNIIKEDSSIICGYLQELLKGKEIQELDGTDLSIFLDAIDIKIYNSENAKVLNQKGLLNIGICPSCGKEIIRNDFYWKYPNSDVKLFLCSRCFINEQKEIKKLFPWWHPKYIISRKNIGDAKYRSNYKRYLAAYEWILRPALSGALFGVLTILIISFIVAIFGVVSWSVIGKIFWVFVGLLLTNIFFFIFINPNDL